MGESQLSCQRVTSNHQQPTTITMEMKLLIVLGAFFVVTLGSPVAEPEAEAAASPTADADAEADPHLLYYGPPTRRLFPIPTLRRMPTTDTTAMADGIIPTMDTPGPTTTDTTGAKIVVQLFNTKLSSFCKKREEIIFFPFE